LGGRASVRQRGVFSKNEWHWYCVAFTSFDCKQKCKYRCKPALRKRSQ